MYKYKHFACGMNGVYVYVIFVSEGLCVRQMRRRKKGVKSVKLDAYVYIFTESACSLFHFSTIPLLITYSPNRPYFFLLLFLCVYNRSVYDIVTMDDKLSIFYAIKSILI